MAAMSIFRHPRNTFEALRTEQPLGTLRSGSYATFGSTRGANVERPIVSVDIVSDGILVRFSDGLLTYFPHDFLRQHVGIGSNQVFLDGNPAADAGLFLVSPELLQQVN